MLAHGLSIAALFAISGELRKQTGTLDYRDLGGLAKSMPLLSFLFGLATFASIGLPGFANFASELLVFFGAFKTATPGSPFNGFQWAAVCGSQRWSGVQDVSLSVGWPVVLLVAALLFFGFVPQVILQVVEPGFRLFLK
jgi:NADH-quinone oxidoreductase subunit M